MVKTTVKTCKIFKVVSLKMFDILDRTFLLQTVDKSIASAVTWNKDVRTCGAEIK